MLRYSWYLLALALNFVRYILLEIIKGTRLDRLSDVTLTFKARVLEMSAFNTKYLIKEI